MWKCLRQLNDLKVFFNKNSYKIMLLFFQKIDISFKIEGIRLMRDLQTFHPTCALKLKSEIKQSHVYNDKACKSSWFCVSFSYNQCCLIKAFSFIFLENCLFNLNFIWEPSFCEWAGICCLIFLSRREFV